MTTDYFPQQTEQLELTAKNDVAQIVHKEQTYKGSWRKRGGIGAFMMLARKWDRIEEMMNSANYDILGMLNAQHKAGVTGDDGSIMAEIRDLRRYLLLLESYFWAQQQPYPTPICSDPVTTSSTPNLDKLIGTPLEIRKTCEARENHP